jgi:hypothetical protein
MDPTLDEAIARLSKTTFRSDPIGGERYSRATSIISSAYKRHGQIIGRALLERLKECARFQVWTEDDFKVSAQSRIELDKGLPVTAYRSVRLPYGDAEQSIPVDVLVFDHRSGVLRSYNVKRGNGSYDAGKRRLILRELLRTQMHLSDYAAHVGLKSTSSEALIIFYYGLRSIPEPFSLVAEELDDHFDFPVYEALEVVNSRFRDRLYALIEGEPGDLDSPG